MNYCYHYCRLTMTRVFRKLDETHLTGPLAVAFFVLAYDVFAIRRNRSTITRDVHHLKTLGYGPEISGAIAGLLFFHLLFRDR
jgi:hypothetical protein